MLILALGCASLAAWATTECIETAIKARGWWQRLRQVFWALLMAGCTLACFAVAAEDQRERQTAAYLLGVSEGSRRTSSP